MANARTQLNGAARCHPVQSPFHRTKEGRLLLRHYGCVIAQITYPALQRGPAAPVPRWRRNGPKRGPQRCETGINRRHTAMRQPPYMRRPAVMTV